MCLDDDEKGIIMSYKDVWDQDVVLVFDWFFIKAKNPIWKLILFLCEIYDLVYEIWDLVCEVCDVQWKV